MLEIRCKSCHTVFEIRIIDPGILEEHFVDCCPFCGSKDVIEE